MSVSLCQRDTNKTEVGSTEGKDCHLQNPSYGIPFPSVVYMDLVHSKCSCFYRPLKLSNYLSTGLFSFITGFMLSELVGDCGTILDKWPYYKKNF